MYILVRLNRIDIGILWKHEFEHEALCVCVYAANINIDIFACLHLIDAHQTCIIKYQHLRDLRSNFLMKHKQNDKVFDIYIL